ncbi:hypothetical protein DPMN_173819 [Dreissena polymorpha]|uniref:Uncharacterized protein n=1 Tax=Dreissena polymorpha TaxID=45954 RepID=A0A9D4E2B0_DREPO|nr:hypothetical protein DPMN_173819 [Dreissena polymorpha]
MASQQLFHTDHAVSELDLTMASQQLFHTDHAVSELDLTMEHSSSFILTMLSLS